MVAVFSNVKKIALTLSFRVIPVAIVSNLWLSSWRVVPSSMAKCGVQVYKIPAMQVDIKLARANLAPHTIMRGPGFLQAAIVIEQVSRPSLVPGQTCSDVVYDLILARAITLGTASDLVVCVGGSHGGFHHVRFCQYTQKMLCMSSEGHEVHALWSGCIDPSQRRTSLCVTKVSCTHTLRRLDLLALSQRCTGRL